MTSILNWENQFGQPCLFFAKSALSDVENVNEKIPDG